MATQQEMYALIGQAAVNGEFRQKLAADPELAAKEQGITLTPEQVAAVKKAEEVGVAAVLEERLPKSFGNSWGLWPGLRM